MTPMLGLGRTLVKNGVSFLTPPQLWTPANITTALWLDANDSSTITLNGSTVSQWSDKSGNARHATQGVGANQPLYGLRTDSKNLINFSQAFDNVFWLKTGGVDAIAPVVTPNVGLAPNGTMTANRVVFNAINAGTSRMYADSGAIVAGQQYTSSYWIKAANPEDVGKTIFHRHVGRTAYLFVTLTAEWQRITRTETAFNSALSFSIEIRPSLGSSSGEVGVLLWGAQLESGTSATSYQPTPNALVFDGVNDSLVVDAAATAIGSNNFTLYAVVNPQTTGSNIFLALRESSGTITRGYLITNPANNQISSLWGDPTTTTTTLPSAVGVSNIIGMERRNGTTVEAFVNGIASGSTVATFPSSYGTLTLGGLRNTSWVNTSFSEVVATIGELSISDRQRLEGYLAWKWGLVANLPSGHPYKNSPPIV